MISIYIQGLNDGNHKFSESVSVKELSDFAEEFVGEIKTEGILTKRGDSYIISGKAECQALFVCDLSLEEFSELIKIDFTYSYNADKSSIGSSENTHLIDGDAKYIDFTDEIRQDLLMALPMKRVAPNYRDKSFDEIFPEYSSNKIKETNSVWDALKNLNVNN